MMSREEYIVRLLGHEERGRLKNFLHPYQESSMFLLGYLQQNEDLPLPTQTVDTYLQEKQVLQFFQCIYWGCFLENELIGVMCYNWLRYLVFQCPGAANTNYIPVMVNYFKQYGLLVDGVFGPEEQATLFCQAFNLDQKNSKIWRKTSVDHLMSLDIPAMPINLPDSRYELNPSLQLVLPREIDRALLMQWVVAFELEALQAEETPEQLIRVATRVDGLLSYATPPLASSIINADEEGMKERPKGWVLVDKELNAPVCLVGISQRIDGMIQIGPVYTPPCYRARGYARECIVRAMREEYLRGWASKSTLLAEDPYALRCYRRVGYREVGQFRLSMLNESFNTSAEN